ncbi:MAG: cation:dicarboxylase symporter family transporter [Bryobacteraceae bacterium]
MTITQQLIMLLTLMLTSKGSRRSACGTRHSFTLATFYLPLEGAAVLLGVDAVLDMARTSVNVVGNCLATAVIARWEGHSVGTAAVRTAD